MRREEVVAHFKTLSYHFDPMNLEFTGVIERETSTCVLFSSIVNNSQIKDIRFTGRVT